MTVTRILYFLVSYNVLWGVLQANQPDGYLGCFKDFRGNSLNNSQYMYNDTSNKGEMCKAECKKHNKRYAGTKFVWCYCGSDVVLNKAKNSTECNQPCPGSSREMCGGYYYRYNNNVDYHRLSIYDTWLCITRPCKNGATCTDINAESYNCSCSVGWTGRVCNAQPSENKLAIYIAVPVSIVVIIVFVLIVTVLILRKKLNQKEGSRKTVNQNSANIGHSLLAVANNAYNGHDIIPLETLVNVHTTEDKRADAATGDIEHSYYTLEQTGHVSRRSYNNADQRGSAIHNDDNGYGHLHVRSTAICDPTYSHTTTTGSQGNTDHTYSRIDQSVGNKNHKVMSNVDHDTYNTCNMKGDVGKHRPAMELNDTDGTYNRLAVSGKAMNIGKMHTISSGNEPDYDHTDVRNH